MRHHGEAFEAFKQSFSYGSRSDLHFEFLASLSDHEAGEFFRQLLETLGDVFDTGDYDRVRELVFEWQVQAYSGKEAKFSYHDGPFARVARPVDQLAVALVSAGGVYLSGDDPAAGETQEQAEARIDDYLREAPILVEIPHETSTGQLKVRHPGYDIRGAQRDVNSVFPLEVLRELEAEKRLRTTDHHYGFVGACSQLQLRNRVAPAWAKRLAAAEMDACLLVAT